MPRRAPLKTEAPSRAAAGAGDFEDPGGPQLFFAMVF